VSSSFFIILFKIIYGGGGTIGELRPNMSLPVLDTSECRSNNILAVGLLWPDNTLAIGELRPE